MQNTSVVNVCGFACNASFDSGVHYFTSQNLSRELKERLKAHEERIAAARR
jgi:hypothetical protein